MPRGDRAIQGPLERAELDVARRRNSEVRGTCDERIRDHDSRRRRALGSRTGQLQQDCSDKRAPVPKYVHGDVDYALASKQVHSCDDIADRDSLTSRRSTRGHDHLTRVDGEDRIRPRARSRWDVDADQLAKKATHCSGRHFQRCRGSGEHGREDRPLVGTEPGTATTSLIRFVRFPSPLAFGARSTAAADLPKCART